MLWNVTTHAIAAHHQPRFAAPNQAAAKTTLWRPALLLLLVLPCCTLSLPAAAQMGGPSMGGGGGGAPPPPGMERPDFRERVWQEGGPQFTPSSGALVADVRVTGNDSVATNQIMALLRTRRDRIFDPEVVQSDVRRLASKGLFRDVRTLTSPAPNGQVIVTFEVIERPTIRYVRFMGNKKIGDKALRKEVGIRPGDAMNRYAIEDARRKAEEYYHSRGFPKAIVELFEGAKPADKGVVFAISEGFVERILDVEFVGNTVATDARLKTQIQSKPGVLWYFLRGKVDRDKIDQDVERITRYYRGLGYFRARVGELAYSPSGMWLSLRFVIDEGPRYKVRNISVNGVNRFQSQQVVENMELARGEFFNLGKMNRDLNDLRDLYGSQGFVYADVEADPRFLEEPGLLDLVYNVDEGQQFRVGDVQVNIAGENPHTRRTVVLNRLSFRPGDVIDIREIRNSERRLQASQLFETNPAMGDPPKISLGTPSLDAANIARGRGRGGRGY